MANWYSQTWGFGKDEGVATSQRNYFEFSLMGELSFNLATYNNACDYMHGTPRRIILRFIRILQET